MVARVERARDRDGEIEIGAERARKPFGKFHNRTCRICPDYFNIFDSSWESVCEASVCVNGTCRRGRGSRRVHMCVPRGWWWMVGCRTVCG